MYMNSFPTAQQSSTHTLTPVSLLDPVLLPFDKALGNGIFILCEVAEIIPPLANKDATVLHLLKL